MRLTTSSPPTLLSLLAILLASTHTTHAKPYLRNLRLETSNALEERTCANPCGAESQYCCQASETCVTSGWPPIAQCVTGSSGSSGPQQQAAQVQNGQYQLVTTTWTETDLILRTSTYSVPISAPTPTVQVAAVATAAIVCDSSRGETPCGGSLCCATGQQCNWNTNMCIPSGGVVGDVSSFYYSSVTAVASGTAFVRPTSNTVQTVTSTGSATTTVPFQSASPTVGGATAGMTAATTNNGLSPGAIAGIVIGVLFGILLLLLICAACCFKGLLDSVMAFFGLGPKKRRTEETYIEERHSHHHSGGGGGGGGRAWFGANRPARVDRPKKGSGGLGGAGAVAAGLGALAVVLGLKRKRDRRDKESYGTRSSYSYSDYTSASSASSDDRRTRGTGRYSRR